MDECSIIKSVSFMPSYAKLLNSGELEAKVVSLHEIMEECSLCPRSCHAKRVEGELGVCGAGSELTLSSAFPHFGEEPPLVGVYGSGTIFLTHCNLKCAFCQNDDISHHSSGNRVSPEQLAGYMLQLQTKGCHNINFVTPTHYAPQIVSAISTAAHAGLELPIVWNCGGYESLEVIKMLEGVVDIYMPDIKFFNPESSAKYCNAPDYPEVVKKILREMQRQVGELGTDIRGIAQRGLLVRHLLMPDSMADTGSILRFIAEEISKDTYINIMDQYRPAYKASSFSEIDRGMTNAEYRQAVNMALELGLHNGFS